MWERGETKRETKVTHHKVLDNFADWSSYGTSFGLAGDVYLRNDNWSRADILRHKGIIQSKTKSKAKDRKKHFSYPDQIP